MSINSPFNLRGLDKIVDQATKTTEGLLSEVKGAKISKVLGQSLPGISDSKQLEQLADETAQRVFLGRGGLAGQTPDPTNGKGQMSNLPAELQELRNNMQPLPPGSEFSQQGDIDVDLVNIPTGQEDSEIIRTLITEIFDELGNHKDGDRRTSIDNFVDTLDATSGALSHKQRTEKPETSKEAQSLLDAAQQGLNAPQSPANQNVVIKNFADAIAHDRPANIMAYVQWVLRESYLETTNSLYDYAEKVRWHNNTRNNIRVELDRARAFNFDDDDKIVGGAGNTFSFNDSFVPKHILDRQAAEQVAKTPATPPHADESKESNETSTETVADISKASPGDTPDATEKDSGKTAVFGAKRVRRVDGFKSPTDDMDERISFCKDGDGISLNEGGTAVIDQLAKEIVHEFFAWFKELDAEEQEALKLWVAENGLSLNYAGTDPDMSPYYKGDESIKDLIGTIKAKPQSGQSFKDYIHYLAEAAARKLTNDFENDGDAGQPDVGRISMIFLVPKFEYDAAQIEQELQADADANANTGTSSSNFRSETDEAPKLPWGGGRVVATKDDNEQYIKHLEERLNTVGEDAQLANVDLNNWLQKQQQTIQMMSNIAKLLHDTAMSVIRNMS